MQDLRLDISQKQQQTLAPIQLRYAKLLEMNGAEIEEEVRRELDDNPALERVSDSTDGEDAFSESSDELQLADYASADDIPSYRLGVNNRSADDVRYEPTAVASESLYDYLMRQLSEVADISDRQREIATFIIGNLDSNGYLTRTIGAIADDIAIALGIDLSTESVREVWNMIRALDPAGIAAVDLRDCLLLQLGRIDLSTP
ncbi:MAG: RNA polymerase sigma-54 factor, partial [Paramuribaculum sp.]|nr:RNA polymerase sigma-54 factor [Paramuribaculum sp.]